MPENFETLVFEREAFWNRFLTVGRFPSSQCTDWFRNGDCCCKLEKPVFWYKQSVRLVFLLVIAEQDHLK